jgi:hypothetical protein
MLPPKKNGDAYLCSAWVNIAVNILIRNIARADFVIKKGGNDVNTGHLYAQGIGVYSENNA